MTGSSPPTLDQVAYFAPIPVLLLDASRCLSDFNLALQVLMGDDVNGWRGQPATEWQQHLGASLVETELLFEATAESIRTGEAHYDSSNFGAAHLRWSAVRSLDRAIGTATGTVLYLEVLSLEKADGYREQLWKLWEWQRLWEEYAVSYDKVLLEMPYYQDVLDRHFRAMTADGIGTILDIGAGTGNLAIRLVEAGLDVTAVDNSRAMLAKLRSKPMSAPAGLHVVEQDAGSLAQFADGAFDGVSLLLTLFDMNEPLAAFREALRVLRPGGTLVLTEPKRTFRMKPILDYCEAHLKERGLYALLALDLERVMKANRSFDPAARPPKSRLWAEDIHDLLCAENFTELVLTDSHFGNCATIRGRKP